MAVAPDTSIDLLVVGKTGYGKSSTANSILGRPAFVASSNAFSETWFAQSAYTRFGKYTIRVTDPPGLCDTGAKRAEGTQMVIDALSQAVLMCPNGFDALLLVLKYGERFTEEDKGVITALRSILGKDFIKKFCIVIFTRGDQLDMENACNGTNVTFEDWLIKQKGELQKLIAECNNRCLLFYNMNPAMKDLQRAKLCAMVSKLRKNVGTRYTSALFEAASKDREELIVKKNAFVLRTEFQKRISLTQDSLNRAIKSLGGGKNDEGFSEVLDQLEEDVESLSEEINAHGKGTNVLSGLSQTVESMRQTLESQRRVLRERSLTASSEMTLSAQLVRYLDRLEEERVPKEEARSPLATLLKSVAGRLFPGRVC